MSPLPRILPAAVAVAIAVLTLLGTALRAQTVQPVKPMALQGVMNTLGQDMQAIAGAISKEDWLRVAALAPKIGNHPEPPLGEKLRILRWLGGDAGTFRGFDRQVHDAALTMGDAAARGDGSGVIAAFAQVQHDCLGCHQRFRKPFRQHFYDAR